MGSIISARDYGAIGDGVHDDTQALNNALAAVSSQGASIILPDPLYKVTGPLTISRHGTHLVGAGKTATKISFNPSSTAVCLDFTKTGDVLSRCSVRNLTLSGGGTQQKIGIRATDTSECDVQGVAIETWTGNTSIGLQLKGRELTTIRRLSAYADRPISIEGNPNSTLDCDHLHMQDLYLVPQVSTESCVLIEPNINVTNLSIDGSNAFAMGTHGVYWNDTEALEGTSLSLRFDGIRREQSEDDSGYTIFINHYTHGVSLRNIKADSSAKGFYFRNVRGIALRDCIYDGTPQTATSPEGLNVDESCDSVNIQGCFWQLGSTRSIGALESVSSVRVNDLRQFPAIEFLDVAVT